MNDPTNNETEPMETTEQAETARLKVVENRASRRGKKPKGPKENPALKRLQLEAQVRELTMRGAGMAEQLGKMAEHLTRVVNNQNALHEGLQNASVALNRTEQYLFSLIRAVLEKTDLSYDDVLEAIDDLAGATDLEVYWGAKEPPTEEELAQQARDATVSAKLQEGWVPTGEDEMDAEALGFTLEELVEWKARMALARAEHEAVMAAVQAEQAKNGESPLTPEELAALSAEQAEQGTEDREQTPEEAAAQADQAEVTE
jgi:hypothetical protein